MAGGDLRQQIGEVLGRLAGTQLDPGERRSLLTRLATLLGALGRAAGSQVALGGQLLVDLVTDVGPHLPVRDLLTLREHHGGRSGEELAEALVRHACRSTAAVGAAGGALSAVELVAPPLLLAAPVQLAAETLAVIAVELKLVAELHVTFGRAPVGSHGQVATAYLSAWTYARGIDPGAAGPGLVSMLGSAARQQLRSRVLRRLGRNLSTLMPFLAGAVAGAELNRRATAKLGAAIVKDLRRAG